MIRSARTAAHLLRGLAALGLLACSAGSAIAQVAPEVAVGAAGRSAADSARALLGARGIPGAQVAILRDGVTVVRLEFGFADVAERIPVTAATLFRVGSISKLFTATAAAMLWDSGRLDLDAPVRRLVPEFGPEDTAVTVRRLAGHLAGVRHYIGRDFMRPHQGFGDLVDALELFSADSLVAPPGTRYQYSSFGYNLLGAAVQRAAGVPFEAFMRDELFEPLALRRTRLERVDSAFADLATGYDPVTDAAPRPATRTDLSDRWPSGGFLSTATEIARFAEASVRGPFLSARVRALLFTPMATADGKSTNVGFGWRVGTDCAGRVVYHHGGASTGGRAMLMAWRDEALVVAITTNLSNARITEADAAMLGCLFLPTP